MNDIQVNVIVETDPSQQAIDMLREASARVPAGLARLADDPELIRKLFCLSPQLTGEGVTVTVSPTIMGAELASTMKALERCLCRLGALPAPTKPDPSRNEPPKPRHRKR
jgi:hypothetical protein